MLGLALVVAMAGVGCGDDDDVVPTDAGTDSGTDSAMPDAGMDAGPPPTPEVFVRIAHLSPNGSPVRVCTDAIIGGEPIGVPGGPLPPAADPAIPFRGVSPYVPFPLPAGVEGYRVLIFAETEGPVTSCTGAPTLSANVMLGEDIEAEGYYTVAAIGFVDERPDVCGAELDGPCPESLDADLVVFEDDTELDAEASKIRVIHAIPNIPAQFGVQICFDPDTAEGEMEPVLLFDRLNFGEATEYFASDAAITAGSLRIFSALPEGMDAPDCQTVVVGEMVVRAPLQELFIPATFSAVKMGLEMGAGREIDQIVTSFALNRITTIFAQGLLGTAPTSPQTAAFVPWQDLPAVD